MKELNDMCLSTVRRDSDPEDILMEFVSRINIDGDKITLTDVLGAQKTLTGSLTYADLEGAEIRIAC